MGGGGGREQRGVRVRTLFRKRTLLSVLVYMQQTKDLSNKKPFLEMNNRYKRYMNVLLASKRNRKTQLPSRRWKVIFEFIYSIRFGLYFFVYHI